MTDQERRLAESIRDACVAAAREAYEDAGIRALCPDGRWEAALGAMKAIDLEEVLGEQSSAREKR
jgi:hypothetical protein